MATLTGRDFGNFIYLTLPDLFTYLHQDKMGGPILGVGFWISGVIKSHLLWNRIKAGNPPIKILHGHPVVHRDRKSQVRAIFAFLYS